MAEINLRDAAARRVGFEQTRPQDSTKTLFTDGASPGKGDVGKLKNQPLAPKDTSDASIAISSPSKEYNVYNHLNHLEMTCGYDVKYFITATALTHAASIFRHIAFGDISSIISQAQKYIEEQKNIADKEFKAAAANVIKNQIAPPKGEILTVEAKKKSEYKYLDQLNIPWNLRIPKSGALEIINNDNGKDIISLDQELASANLVEDKSFPLSIEVNTGQDMYSCPQKPMPKGGFFLGKLTRPLFIPIKAGTSYGGIFGKWFSEAKQVIVSQGVALSEKLKTSSAVAANRMVIPTKIDETGDSSLVSLPLLSDFANIINVPVLYDEKDSKDYVKYLDTNKDLSKEDATKGIEIDSAWKQAIANGDLFYDQTGISYSKESLSSKTVIKHGTKNLTVQDLDKAISEVRDKITSPILGRISIPGAAKTGQSTPDIDNNSIKTFDQYSNLKVKEYIKEKDWQDIISLKLSNKTRWIGGLKSGTGAKTYSDIPSFVFWTPIVSYLGKESDGSIVYGHSEPSVDVQFNQLQILYSESPPYAELKFGAERKAWDSAVVYSFSNSEILQDNIAPYIDPNILRYGLGSFIGKEYHLPISSILEACSSLSGSLIENGIFSGTNFGITHTLGNTKVDIYNVVLTKISKNLITSNLVGTSSDLEDKLTDSAFNKLWTKSASKDSLDVSFSDISMIATENETLVGEDKIYTVDTKGNVSKNSPRFNSKVILGSLKDAKIHFGKEVNVQALEPIKAGANVKISDILISSKVKKTSLYNPEDNSFIVDIQPGENIFYSDNKIKYITDPYVPNSAIPEEALFDQNISNRPSIVDIVSSFISPVSDKSSDVNKEASTVSVSNKPADQNAVKNLSLSNLAITKIVLGVSNDSSSSKIDSSILKPILYNENSVNNSSPDNGYISSSLFGDFIFSLVSHDHFYSELLTDYKKSKVSLMGLAFTNLEEPGSIVKVTKKDDTTIVGRIVEESSDAAESFKIIDNEGKQTEFLFTQVSQVKKLLTPTLKDSLSADVVKEYFTTPSGTIVFNPLSSEEDEPDNLNYINSNISFFPWPSFASESSKIPEGEKILEIFEPIDPSDNIDLFLNNLNYGYSSLDNLFNQLKLSVSSTETTGPIKIFLSEQLRNVDEFESYVSLSSNISWLNQYLINEYKINNDLISLIYPDLSSKILKSVTEAVYALSAETFLNGVLWGGKEIAKAKYLFPVDIQSSEDILIASEEFITNLVNKYNLLGNSTLLDINLFTSMASVLDLDYNNSQRDKEALTLGVFCLAGIILNDWVRKDNSKLKNLIKDAIEPYYIYLKSLEGSDLNSIPYYTTNGFPELAIFLNSSKEALLLGKVNDSGKQITDSFAVLKSKLLANWTVMDSSTSIFIPGTDTIKIPICLVEALDGLEDKYKFIDNTESYSLETFTDNILEGKWKVLYKVLTPGWLGNSSNADLALIRKSITHASFIVQLLDMIGFALQAFIENSRVFDKLEVKNEEEPDPAKRITTAISLRKDKIKNSAIYQRDSFGIGDLSTRDREFLIPLKDFTNMVKVSKEGESVKINRMYPLILKDLSSDDLRNGITENSIVGPDVMDLGFINSPSDNRLMSMFIRPGYGYPDIVKNLGYRCVINNFQTFVKTQTDPKRFAFHGKWKKNQASLFSDRMLQQSVTDEIWDKVIKSTEWTENIKKDPATALSTSLLGMNIPNSYLSKFDNPNVLGINKTAIFDIEFGYLSSRPVFSQNVNFTIPQFSGGVKFVAKAVNKKLQYRGNYPANLGVHLRTGYDRKANAQELEASGAYSNALKVTKKLLSTEDEVLPENSIKSDLMILTGSSLPVGVKTLESPLTDFYKSTDKNLGDSLYILGLLGIPVSSSIEELESINSDNDINSLKTKIVSLINEDKLRDISFVKNAQVTITGKTYTDYVGNQHVYPFVPAGTGLDTFEGILSASFDQYNSITQGGQDHDHIYDFHPLSFLTSASNIGLSKRRSVLFGALTMAGILKDYVFVRDKNAINPYAGVYYKYPNISFDNDNREIAELSGRNGFKKNNAFTPPSLLSVIIIPDFSESESSISQLVNVYLGGVSSVDDNLSNSSIFEFFGVGSFLGAEYFEPGKEKQRQTKLLTNDNYGEDTSNYNSGNVILLKNLFSRYYEIAKQIPDFSDNVFLNFIAGSFLPRQLSGETNILDYIDEYNLDSVILSVELNKDESSKISASLNSCFDLEGAYSPVYYDAKDSIIYYSAAAICHIKKKIKDKSIKEPVKESFEDILDLLLYSNPDYLYLDGSTSCENDLDLVDSIDLYSLLSGYKDVKTLKRLSITEEGKGKDIESSFAISAQVYIGPSETGSEFTSSPNSPFSVAVSQTNVDKLQIPSFAATRNFGQNKNIFNLISDSVGLGKILVRKTKGSEILETVLMDKDAIFLSAVNRILLSRSELKLRYLFDRFGNVTLKTYLSDTKKLDELTLKEISYVPSNYFVQKIGPILKNSFSNTSKTISFSSVFGTDSSKLNCFKNINNNKHMMLMGATVPNAAEFAKNFVTNQTTYLGTRVNPVAENGLVSGSTNRVGIDLESFDKKTLATLWSLFSMKMFLATDNIGVKLEESEIKAAQIPIGEIGRTKPIIVPIGKEVLRVYSDIDTYDFEESQNQSPNYITRFKSVTIGAGNTLKLDWRKLNTGSIEQPGSSFSETVLPTVKDQISISSTLDQQIKVVAKSNGLQVINFSTIGIQAP